MRNPNSSFGDVSKHVASLWDGLDPGNSSRFLTRNICMSFSKLNLHQTNDF